MYSGGDVVSAFNHPDVQTALEAHRRYAASSEGVLRANGHPGSITWSRDADATSPPIGVAQLHDVLDVVMLNRKLTCPGRRAP